MELFGIVCAVPTAFVAAGIYAYLIRFVLRYRLVSRIALWISTAVLVGLLLEWGALVTVGAVRSRAIIGPAFYPVHLVIFFLAIPALANLLVIQKGEAALGSGVLVAVLWSAL